MRITFTIPGKPVPLHRARAVRTRTGVRMFTPEDSVKYQNKIRRAAVLAGCPLFAKGCRVLALVFFPDNRSGDGDNVLKSCLDALQASVRLNRRAIAWKNDREVGGGTFRCEVDRLNPRVELTIVGDVAPP